MKLYLTKYWCVLLLLLLPLALIAQSNPASTIGKEVSIERHLKDDEEFDLPLEMLIEHGKALFAANWTIEEGAGRPLTKGTGRALSDPNHPLVGERAFNRISGPDANSCAGCHNAPFGVPGGGGDFVGNVFVLGQRFDAVTFDKNDKLPTSSSVDEQGIEASLTTIANQRSTTGMFGAGYIEMLAREMTEDLQKIRDSVQRGGSKILRTKGVSFGRITRRADGTWDVSQVVGLPRFSIITATPLDPPTLVIRPWHQASNVVSLREFSNNAMNQHHGIQSTERFGVGDADGDEVYNEMTRADMTALAAYQAVMAVPGQVIPNDPQVEEAITRGREAFNSVGCNSCHIPELPLYKKNWIYTEPNPYNPSTNLRSGETKDLSIDLTDPRLPQPRLVPASPEDNYIMVPVFSDLKLHDITDSNDSDGVDPLDMNQSVWSPKFKQGNRRFLTKRLWGAANEPPYFHHGYFTTLREAIMAHSGEAKESREAFEGLSENDKDSLIEFLKSLQVLPPGTKDLVIDENGKSKVGF